MIAPLMIFDFQPPGKSPLLGIEKIEENLRSMEDAEC